jgi:AAA15 family ATPase/GTPase
MYITKIRVKSYKSFNDPGDLELKTGFNIIAGQNNAGKTALLEALGLKFQSVPHRSTQATPPSTGEQSTADFELCVTAEEFRSILHNHIPESYIAIPDKTTP